MSKLEGLIDTLTDCIKRRNEIEDNSGILATLFGSSELKAVSIEIDYAKYALVEELEHLIETTTQKILDLQLEYARFLDDIDEYKYDIGIFKRMRGDKKLKDMKYNSRLLWKDIGINKSNLVKYQEILKETSGSGWENLGMFLTGLGVIIGVGAGLASLNQGSEVSNTIEELGRGYANTMPGRMKL